MTTILYAVTLFLALSSLLKWKFRRESRALRLRRSLHLYSARVLAELSGGVVDGFSSAPAFSSAQ